MVEDVRRGVTNRNEEQRRGSALALHTRVNVFFRRAVSVRGPVSGGAITNKFCWISADDGIGLDVFRDNRASSEHGSVADCDAGQNDNPRSNPHVITDDDGIRACATLLRHRDVQPVGLVIRGDDDDIRSHHDVLSQGNRTIQSAVDAEAGIISDSDIASIAEESLLFHVDATSHMCKQPAASRPAENPCPPAVVIVRCRQMPREAVVGKEAHQSGEAHRYSRKSDTRGASRTARRRVWKPVVIMSDRVAHSLYYGALLILLNPPESLFNRRDIFRVVDL